MNRERANSLLLDKNNIVLEHLDHIPIHKLFERQVARSSEQIAVIYEQERLTYAELNRCADQAAQVLQANGVASGSYVPLIMYKGINLLVAMLAVMKSGAAYVPVDPDWPLERIRYVLSDVRSLFVVTEPMSAQVAGEEAYILNYCSFLDCHVETADTILPAIISDDSDDKKEIEAPMYVIYTSGSTGKPKGAIIPHRGIANRFQWMTETLGSETSHTTLQLSSPSFDSSVWQFFWPLAHGGKTVIPAHTMEKTAVNILKLVSKYKISLLHVVPSMLDFLTEQLLLEQTMHEYMSSVEYLWVGGEKLSSKTVVSFKSMFPHIHISNHYGPTETSIACLYHPIETLPDGDIPLGKAINNVHIVLMDDNGQIASPGELGEICVGGAGVGLGYLWDSEKTAMSFIPNPFPELNCEQLYKTGDIGRLLPDGSIAFIGRNDFQVKIRGFRVDLSEIETLLMEINEIFQVIVLTRQDARGDSFLVAYYRSKQVLEEQTLKRKLLQHLPEYMVPLHYVHMDKMPLLTNGKIDLLGLLSVPLDTHSVSGEFPSSEMENALAAIWESLLGVSSIRKNSDFFQLGGQSLKAARCAMIVNKEYNVNLKIADVFHYTTLELLSAYIDSLRDETGNIAQYNIEITNHRAYYPVTSAQKRLYILQRTPVAHTAYNIPGFLIIKGRLNIAQLEKALNQLIIRHEALRTSFHWENKELVQVINPVTELKLEQFYLNGRSPQEVASGFVRPFELSKTLLFRAGIIPIDLMTHLFMFDVHHIVADAISVNVLLEELFTLYQEEKLEESPIRFRDYAVWQQENITLALEHEKYWLDQFAGFNAAASLPLDYPRSLEKQYDGARVKRYLTPEQNKRLDLWCRESGTTKYMVLFSIFSIMQMHYTSHEDIVVGTSMAGRQQPATERLVGMFVHTLALRTYPNREKSFRSYLNEVKQKVLEALDRQEYPFERLIEKLEVMREPGRNPLFDTMFVLQNMDLREAMLVSQGMHVTEQRLYDWTLTSFEYEHHSAKFDLMLEAVERNGLIGLKFDYSTTLFKEETVELFAESFIKLLDRFLSEPDALLSEISCITDRQRQVLLEQFNNTAVPYSYDKTLDQLFDEQTLRYPHCIAVRSGDEQLSYLELNERASKVASVLKTGGIQIGEAVGIMTERSVDMLVGILGILKAGAAYMPIDPAYPQARIDYMLDNSGASKILLHRNTVDSLVIRGNMQIILLDELPEIDEAQLMIGAQHTSRDIAYIIYTSGTTGQPKGVMIEHHSVINRIQWMQKEYPIGPDDVVMQKTTFTFDVSVWELFWWMFAGASITLLEPGAEKDPRQICEKIITDQVTVMHFVPSMFSLFLEYIERSQVKPKLNSLRYVFTSGEALSYRQVNRFYEISTIEAALINVYGPTEATIDVTFHLCERNEEIGSVPIGKPIDNTEIYILNEQMDLVPIGVPGQLWISGVGVARGYLNQIALTEQKFIDCPFKKGQKMYQSGDIARWLTDGQLEYLGRSDHQLKIRGFRIEADDIIHHALTYPKVKEAVVRALGEEEIKRLCLYVVADGEVNSHDLKGHLASMLPDYMIPEFVVQLNTIPLSSNGKVDLKQLPEPSISVSTSNNEEQEQSLNSVESDLLEIWRNLLEIDHIGLDDDFFNIGGNSLYAIRVEIELEAKGYPIDHIGVFRYRTIRSYAKHIQAQLAESNSGG